jgi:hypothetical protein
VHVADIQDRDGAPDLLVSIYHLSPWLSHVFAHGACAGEKLKMALAGFGHWTIEIVKRTDQAKGFQVPARRWVAEWPSELSPGLAVNGGWPRTSRRPLTATSHGFSGPPSSWWRAALLDQSHK